MPRRTLAEWLDWQSRLHPAGIALGLDRVRRVWRRLEGLPAETTVVTVGGTNGKGSMVALLEAVCRRAGFRTGAYTSPHLLRYNERIRIDGEPVADEALVAAFETVEQARAGEPLTYFEYGTLAALTCFARARCSVVFLEVGLGGRLDAVNLVDAHCALLGQIELDHTEWLGPDREAIGREKAGIFRPGRPAVCGDPHPPDSVRRAAASLGADLRVAGEHFRYRVRGDGRWDWEDSEARFEALPPPGLPGAHQYANAAAVVTALRLLAGRMDVPEAALRAGLAAARLPGRFEAVATAPEVVLDVAHNPAAARALARLLAERPAPGRTRAVFAALEDKDAAGLMQPLISRVDHWHLAGLGAPRGLSAEALAARLPSGPEMRLHADVGEALAAALAAAADEDRILVFGSFHTVAAAREALADILAERGEAENG